MSERAIAAVTVQQDHRSTGSGRRTRCRRRRCKSSWSIWTTCPTDGRSRRQDVPEAGPQKPRRKPITDEVSKAIYDLGTVTKRLVRLAVMIGSLVTDRSFVPRISVICCASSTSLTTACSRS